MKIVDASVANTLSKMFPDINALLYDDDYLMNYPMFQKMAISAYDHWLTEEEQERNVVSYVNLEHASNPEYDWKYGNQTKSESLEMKRTYFQMEVNYLSFFLELEKDFKVYNYANDSHGYFYTDEDPVDSTLDEQFCEFDNLKDYMFWCLSSVRELCFMNLCIPDLELIIIGGFDLKNSVYYKNREQVGRLNNYIHENGLFLLSYPEP